jgi:hypothetical protein
MGYLISAHIVRDRPDIDRVAELPASIGHRIYYHRSANVYVIDTFRAARPPAYPFQTPVPAVDIPLELPPELDALESIYNYLNKLQLANSFKKSYINFGLLLNRLLGLPILSFISDGDEWDFACTVAEGSLSRLKCRCGDMVITFQDDNTRIQPLVPEFEDDDEFLTNLDDLRTALPSVFVADRDVAWDAQLHAVAIEEWRLFGGTDTAILGLGSFDPPEDESDWELIGGS